MPVGGESESPLGVAMLSMGSARPESPGSYFDLLRCMVSFLVLPEEGMIDCQSDCIPGKPRWTSVDRPERLG